MGGLEFEHDQTLFVFFLGGGCAIGNRLCSLMLLSTPVLLHPASACVRGRALAAVPPPDGPWRKLAGAKRRRRVLFALFLLSLAPYMMPEERRPALYKDGLTSAQRDEREQARRVRRALYP